MSEVVPPPTPPPGLLARLRAWGGRESLWVLVAFALGVVLGAGAGPIWVRSAQEAQELSDRVVWWGTPGLFERMTFGEAQLFIFLRNLRVVGVMVAGGLLLRILPLLIVSVNGAMLGFMGLVTSLHPTLRLGDLLLFTIPHGIFELTAFGVAAVAAARIPRVARGRGFRGRLGVLVESIPALLLSVGLLLLASCLEARHFHSAPRRSLID